MSWHYYKPVMNCGITVNAAVIYKFMRSPQTRVFDWSVPGRTGSRADDSSADTRMWFQQSWIFLASPLSSQKWGNTSCVSVLEPLGNWWKCAPPEHGYSEPQQELSPLDSTLNRKEKTSLLFKNVIKLGLSLKPQAPSFTPTPADQSFFSAEWFTVGSVL